MKLLSVTVLQAEQLCPGLRPKLKEGHYLEIQWGNFFLLSGSWKCEGALCFMSLQDSYLVLCTLSFHSHILCHFTSESLLRNKAPFILIS